MVKIDYTAKVKHISFVLISVLAYVKLVLCLLCR